MTVHVTQGDIFKSHAQVLVNPVNCVGAMGKGLALQFKRRFPQMLPHYRKVCQTRALRPGLVLQADVNPPGARPQWVLNAATKDHWAQASKLEWVSACLDNIVRFAQVYPPQSLAVPALGCGEGGLRWDDVRPLMIEKLGVLDETQVWIYEPAR